MTTRRAQARPQPVRRTKRPIDKQLISVSKTTTTSQSGSTLYTTTFPGTVVGLRWDLACVSLTTSPFYLLWAIVVVHDGNTATTMSGSDGTDFYTPEQDVLAFGIMRGSNTDGAGPITDKDMGMTKTMRKLKQGDVLQLINLNSVANGASLQGIVQFFIKT